ncbi:MAG: LamG-like jellyroll fold domain-containing protein, partial [Microgenomates group bacterium]
MYRKLRKKIKNSAVKISVFIFTFFYLFYSSTSPVLASTVSDSYADASKINDSVSSNYAVYGGQLKLAHDIDTGDGTDGALTVSSGTTTLDTNANPGGFDYTNVTVSSGATLTATGSNPLIIRATGTVDIQGTLTLNGGNGGNGGSSAGVGGTTIAGGGAGGNGASGPGNGASGSGPGGGGGGILCSNSFEGSTIINTPNGNKPISEVEKGELVYSYNPSKQVVEAKQVIEKNKHRYPDEGLYKIFVEEKYVLATPHHRFYTENLEVKSANELKPEDVVYVYSNGEIVKKKINHISTDQKKVEFVYGIIVEDNHNYFANGILNKNGDVGGGGGGGSFGTSGGAGGNTYCGPQASAGSTYGDAPISTLEGGSGGGGGGGDIDTKTEKGAGGGGGGGAVQITAGTITVSGTISANGGNGGNHSNVNDGEAGAGGGGSGGSIKIQGISITLGTNLVTATGGSGGTSQEYGTTGGNGGNGRIAIYYVLSISGTTNPSAYTSVIEASYKSSATIQSINLLSGEPETVDSINEFVYNLSSKPAETGATIQFSQNATTWLNSSGTVDGTDTLTTGANNTIILSNLGWSGANFYYKTAFTGDGSNTPTLDDITINYTISGSCGPPLGGNYSITKNCTFTTDSSLTKIADMSTNGNAGTVTGATIVAGKYGSARSFNGADDYILVNDNSSLNLTNIAISAWVNYTSTTGVQVVVWKWDVNPYKQYYLSSDGTNLKFAVNTASGNNTATYSMSGISTGTWYHVAGMYNGTTAKIYVDGVEGTPDSTYSGNINNTEGKNLYIGRGYYNSAWENPFNGLIDDVRIYNYARSEEQINEDMNEVITITGNAPVGHWRMDDGYIDGVDNGDLTIPNYTTLTINAGQTIAWNPDKSIIIEDGASIAINTSGRLRQTYLWVTDADGDGWYDGAVSEQIAHSTQPANYRIRRYLTIGPAYGDGGDSNITFTTNTNLSTWNNTGRSCADGGDAVSYSVTGLTSNTATLSSTPSSGCLAAGDHVLLINLQGTFSASTNVGNHEILKISSISINTITFTTNKTKYFGNGASDDTNIGTTTSNQRVVLQRIPQYTDVTVNSGVSLYANSWDGTKGGVLAFKASGTATVTGTITMSSRGYLGGKTVGSAPGDRERPGGQGGESYCGPRGAPGNHSSNGGDGAGGGGSGASGNLLIAGSGSCGGGGGVGGTDGTVGIGSA